MPSSTSERRARIAVVVSGWPRLSETFALHDLVALRDAGVLAAVFATKPGDHRLCQPGIDGIDVTVLPPGTATEQARTAAQVLAGRRVTGVHGYFAHQPAEVAAAMASASACRTGSAPTRSTSARWTRTIWRRGPAVRRRSWRAMRRRRIAGRAGVSPALVGHGVDTERFRPPCRGTAPSRSAARRRPVGREEGLRRAGRRPRRASRRPGASTSSATARSAVGSATWSRGSTWPIGSASSVRSPMTSCPLYGAADVVVVPSRVDARNDRDGLPNVVLEAMASGRPVVASDVAAIGTAVVHGQTGLLVPPDDPDRLAAALDLLGADRALRRSLGHGARLAALADHDLATCRRGSPTPSAAPTERAMAERAVAYVAQGLPRRSELFIASEIWRLEQLGVRLHLIVLTPSEEVEHHAVVEPCRPCRGTCRR